jgi:hypothetical protein
MEGRRMKRLAAVVAGVMLIGAIAACTRKSDSVSGTQATQYTLLTIDGRSLPHQISQSSDGTVTTAMADMVFTIVEDNTWHSVGHQTVTTDGVPSTEVVRNGGSYFAGTDSALFRDEAGNLVWAGAVTENEVSVRNADGLVWLFER